MKLKIDDFSKLTLRKFYEIDKLKNTEDVVDYEIGVIAILCDCTTNDILELPIGEYKQLRAEAQFLANFPDIKPNCPDNITINGKKYDIMRDLDKVTTAQYIDFQSYLKMENNVQYVLSCFLIPEGKKYMSGYNIDEVINDILELDIKSALSVCFFFTSLYLLSISSILHSLESRLKKQIRKTKDKEMREKLMSLRTQIDSLINGDGYIMSKR